MSDKNLRETLREVVSETKETAPKQKETKEELSGTGGETKSGETPQPEYVRGIDISDVPEADRPRIRELLEKKASLLEKGVQSKFQEVATLKKLKEELTKEGLSEDEVRLAVNDFKAKKSTPAQKKEADRLLDELIQEAPEQKNSLERLRKIIVQESNSDTLEKKIDKLEETLSFLTQGSAATRAERINSELDTLSAKYGNELIDKYRDDVVREGVKYVNASVRQLLHAIANPDELEQAMTAKTKKPMTQEKKNAISSEGSGVTSASEQIDHKKLSYGGLLKQLSKI